MDFGYTIVYVEDVGATLGFYERAFGQTRGFVAEGGHYGELATGPTKLAFASVEMADAHLVDYHENRPDSKPAAAEVAFVTDDVDRAFATAVAAGAAPLARPEKKPWGQTVAYVRDNNGFPVELCTPTE